MCPNDSEMRLIFELHTSLIREMKYITGIFK